MNEQAGAIEDFFRRRYGREALYVPSGRLALYLAFSEWLRPGDRVLMSPVNDDVVFFTVLAAGLMPVLGPVDPRSGNTDPVAITDSTWAGLHAVLTTNLYGIPDRMDLLEERSRRYGLLLLEDAAQALDSRFNGRRIGEFGPVAIYSLSKHIGGAGGVLTFSESGRRASLVRRAREQTRYRSLPRAAASRLRSLLSTWGASTRARKKLARLRDRLFPPPKERSGHRIAYEPADVLQAQQEGGGLSRFDRWVRIDNHAYRTWLPRSSGRATLRRLETFEEDRRPRLAGARKLLELGLMPPGLPVHPDTALFRVPLFVREREKVLAHFAQHGLILDYIYDPPLDLYAPELAERLASPLTAMVWSRDVLPVDPLLADRFLALLGESGVLCMPSLDTVQAGERAPALSVADS